MTKLIIQRVYEVFCVIGMISMVAHFKQEVIRILPLLVIPFLIVSYMQSKRLKLIVMGIFLGLLSYVAWSWVITIEITNLLDNYISLPEHSLWDIFAFLLPLILSVVTLIWAIRKRESVPKYDQWYMLSVLICLALLEIIY